MSEYHSIRGNLVFGSIRASSGRASTTATSYSLRLLLRSMPNQTKLAGNDDGASLYPTDSGESMMTVNVDDVAASLEQAAAKVKQLRSEFAGAQDIKASVDLLTAQVQTLHGTLAKNHADVISHSQKLIAVTQELTKQQRMSKLVMQAQVHNQMVRKWSTIYDHQICLNDKRVIVFTAEQYGWKLGGKTHNGETDDQQIERRWKDALDCLEVVTVPSLTYSGAAYDNFVC